MANRLKGEATFRHEEHGELTLCFDTEAFLEFEDATDIGLLDLAAGAGTKLGTLAMLMIQGLKRHHPELEWTRVEAAELLMFDDAAKAAVMTALKRAMPDVPDDASAGGNVNRGQRRAAKSKAGTGTNG